MRHRVTWTAFAVAIAVPALVAARMRDPDLALQPTSRIWVDGTSNVKDFECNAAKMDVVVQTNQPNAVHAVSAGNKAVGSVDVTVPVATMDCKNGTMNDHMREALKATDHPSIEFKLESYDLVKAADSVAVTVRGTLSIGGTTKPVTINAEARDAGGGVLHLAGEYDVHMKEFDLKPPSLMMGMMKVDEMVKVRFDLLLKS